MSGRDELNSVVLAALTAFLNDDDVDIRPDTRLEDDLGLDSTEIIDIFVDLEKQLRVSLKDIRFSDLKTFDGLVAAIAERVDHGASVTA